MAGRSTCQDSQVINDTSTVDDFVMQLPSRRIDPLADRAK